MRDSKYGHLGCVLYTFIAITPSSTLTQSSGTCSDPIYGCTCLWKKKKNMHEYIHGAFTFLFIEFGIKKYLIISVLILFFIRNNYGLWFWRESALYSKIGWVSDLINFWLVGAKGTLHGHPVKIEFEAYIHLWAIVYVHY